MSKRIRFRSDQRRVLEAYVFYAPFIVGCVIFFLFPIFMSIRVSLSDITRFAGFKMELIGFAHYVRAFVWDINFIPLFINVVRYTLINSPLIVIFALIFAVLLNKKIRGRGFFRTVFFIPFLLGQGYIMQEILGQGVDQQSMQVARGILFPQEIVWYLGPAVYGAINGFLTRITIVLWRLGVQVLLFLSGLQGISPSLYESARVDGATEWECFWKITLPMVSPVILLSIVYTFIDSFTDINNPIQTYMYERAFRLSDFEYAAAMSWIYCAFVLLVLGVVFLFMKRFVYEAGRK